MSRKIGSNNVKRRYSVHLKHRLWILPMVLFACVCAVSLYSLAAETIERVKTRHTNSELQLGSNESEAEDTATPYIQPSATPDPVHIPNAIRIANDPSSSFDDCQTMQYIADSPRAECASLLERNPDFIGKITIDDILDLPVVYRDNTFYLSHDFDSDENSAGTLFLDETHPFDEDTQYLIIHGHNVYDGSMFGILTHYRRLDFARRHTELTFYTLYRRETYRLFAVVYVPEADFADVLCIDKCSFDTDDEFASFIRSLKSHAIHFADPGPPANAAILALSTCYNDGRIVVLFYRDDSNV